MSYAVRNDGKGWRAVGSEADITSDETYSLTQPKITLDQVKAGIQASIRAERIHRTETGGYLVDGNWFHSDTFSRSQQLGLFLLAANTPADLQWKTMDGTYVTMTQTLVANIVAASVASDTVIFLVAESHIAAVETSSDPSTYDYSTGWPKIYGEV